MDGDRSEFPEEEIDYEGESEADEPGLLIDSGEERVSVGDHFRLREETRKIRQHREDERAKGREAEAGTEGVEKM